MIAIAEEDKNILLNVANEIEADENYSGEAWYDTKNNCGCAIVRILSKKYPIGVKIEEDGGYVYFENDIGPRVYLYEMEKMFGVNRVFWNSFQNWTLYADRFQTANKLREIAEGDFILPVLPKQIGV